MNATPDCLLSLAAGAALFAAALCMNATAQSAPDPALKALLAKLEAGRVPAAKSGSQSLRLEGTYTVTFDSAPGTPSEPAAEGPFIDLYVGDDLARHTSSMGEFGAMERGVHKDVVWEVDPAMGAKVHTGSQAAVVRRYFAVLCSAHLSDRYKEITRKGTETIAGREHTVLRLTPAEGASDLAYVDADGVLSRIDMALPVPESAEAGFGIDDAMLAKIEFADWKTIGGVRYAQRRTMRMGPAIVTFVTTKIEPDAKIDAAKFAPPEAVTKLEPAAVEPAFGADGKPNYQIVDRPAQAVVSIRIQCKPAEINTQLGIILPEVMAHVTASGAKMAGPPFSRYHSFGEDTIDLEAGIPVQKPVTEKGRIKNSELPAGKTVTCWHIGAYDKLTMAHTALTAHLAAHKLVARGGVWEVYWTDPGMVPDPKKWRTQLFAPIE